MSEKKNISLLKLFTSMLMISSFTFGGGFVIIGMMKKKFCEELHWVNDDEVLDMVAIAQSAPGALAINSSIIFGYRLAGIKGVIVSTLGTAIPPIIIISLVCLIYDAFATNHIVQIALQVMRAGVAAIIFDIVLELAGNVFKTKNMLNIILMFTAFVASWFFKVSAITIILICIALGIALSLKKEECK